MRNLNFGVVIQPGCFGNPTACTVKAYASRHRADAARGKLVGFFRLNDRSGSDQRSVSENAINLFLMKLLFTGRKSSMPPMVTETSTIVIGDVPFATSRPHRFGLVIERPMSSSINEVSEDYLHEILLAPPNRDGLLTLIETEGLVVCKNVRSDSPSYRRVRGKSSFSKLSQAEYYHHDGCSSPTKPRVVEIRCPHQDVSRNVATAIAPFPDVIRAMLRALPESMLNYDGIQDYREKFSGPPDNFPPPHEWDSIQGKVTRLVRKEMDAEACRAYFRSVDELAGAYALPWEMGESRLMLNASHDLTRTMQHRRAYQKPRSQAEQNGSLVKRWTAEEA